MHATAAKRDEEWLSELAATADAADADADADKGVVNTAPVIGFTRNGARQNALKIRHALLRHLANLTSTFRRSQLPTFLFPDAYFGF